MTVVPLLDLVAIVSSSIEVEYPPPLAFVLNVVVAVLSTCIVTDVGLAVSVVAFCLVVKVVVAVHNGAFLVEVLFNPL